MRFLWSIRKSFAYLVFGVGSLIIGLIILPAERLLIHPASRFRHVGRLTITYSHRAFISMCKAIRLLEIEKPLPDFSDLGGKIVSPNHPSLFDVVIMFALIPGADCIVRGALTRTVTGFIVRALYIVNSEDFDTLKEDCRKSLDAGNTLIIFPEGTRTKKNIPINLKRGTAYISLYTGAEIVPVIIGGNSKDGLRKKNHFYSVNDTGRYIYTIRRPDKVFDPAEYDTGNPRSDAINLTDDMEAFFRKEAGSENL